MICNAPEWILKIFDYFDLGEIDQFTLNNAMSWLYQKGIILCNDVI